MVSLDSLLTRTPGVCGGRLCIAGTRLYIQHIGSLWRAGYAVEDIARDHPDVPLEGIYAAMAYYHANRVQIDAEIEADRLEYDRLARLSRAS